MLVEKILEQKYEKLFRKLHKCVNHRRFLTECLESKVYPKFTRIASNVVKQLSLNPGQIYKMRSKQIEKALEIQSETEKKLKSEIFHIHSILCSFIQHKTLKLKIKNIENRVVDLEKLNDYKRSQKLKRLKNHLTEHIFNKVKIENLTNKIIPYKEEKFLQFGLKHGVGGSSNKFQNLNKMETLFNRWLYYAQSIKLDIFKINEVRSLLYLEFQKLNTCNSETSGPLRVKKLFEFK